MKAGSADVWIIGGGRFGRRADEIGVTQIIAALIGRQGMGQI